MILTWHRNMAKFLNQKPQLELFGRGVIVRDDVLPGGTKQRGLMPYLLNHHGDEFVYASPVYGYAQIALAISAQIAGKRATVFTAKRKTPHPLTLKAHSLGAKIVQVPNGYLNVVQKRAKDYAIATDAHYLPFGANVPDIAKAITAAAQSLDINPPEVWTVSGSGTLTRALQKAWPQARFYTVLIGKTGINTGIAQRYQAPEAFEQRAKKPPPFPSCENYDAKAWQFFAKYAGKNALFWNVAS